MACCWVISKDLEVREIATGATVKLDAPALAVGMKYVRPGYSVGRNRTAAKEFRRDAAESLCSW